jgi:hypothetical protein
MVLVYSEIRQRRLATTSAADLTESNADTNRSVHNLTAIIAEFAKGNANTASNSQKLMHTAHG